VGLGVVRRINYLAKKELFSNKVYSYFLRKLFRTIPIDREQMERATLRTIYQLLNTNEILLMFPEGTRSFDGNLQEAKIGIGMIAYNSKVPIIPVYVNGSHDILPRDAKRVYFKRCSVFFGPPVELSRFYQKQKSKELYKEISEKIMEAIAKLEVMSNQNSTFLDSGAAQ
jgi:1-acyl-sn-glycerol-3-phosphate acyltransferase